MWIKQTFSNSIYLEVVEKEENSGAVRLQQCFEPIKTLITEWSAEARPFRRLSKDLFRMQ